MLSVTIQCSPLILYCIKHIFREFQSRRNYIRSINSCLILIIKPTRCTNFSNVFWNRSLHVSDSSSVHHQESSTVHTEISIYHTGFADCVLARSQRNLYEIYLLLCVQCWTPDDGQRDCPKHVEIYSKINLRI